MDEVTVTWLDGELLEDPDCSPLGMTANSRYTGNRTPTGGVVGWVEKDGDDQ